MGIVNLTISTFVWQVSELMIPTDETARQMFFLEAFLTHNKPLLFIGPTGTGKSAITNNYIIGMPKEKYDLFEQLSSIVCIKIIILKLSSSLVVCCHTIFWFKTLPHFFNQ